MARDEYDASNRSMISKKPVPDMIWDGYQFSDKICSVNVHLCRGGRGRAVTKITSDHAYLHS